MKFAAHFLACWILGTTLGSCSNADKSTASTSSPVAPSESAAPVKSPSNPTYTTPRTTGPVPRNPSMHLPANFSKDAGVSFSRVSVTDPYVAMTFDDGPHPKNTPRLLDMLRERNIKATFYVIGRNVDLYPAVVRRIVAEGHEIGNHSYTHGNLSKMSDDAVRTELTKTRDAIVRAAGVQPRTLRPPYGALLQRQREWIHSEMNYPTILWSVDPRDWQRPGPSVVTSRILSGTTPGAIVLSHDLHAPTVDAMPATLDGLLRKGYKFVTVSQLLAMKPAEATAQAANTPAE
ncbi:peptidoglycan/xylan/chitin deacetylase (PgdA/CDA1 family) [Haloferula luteola]|uniref:Peptidoglycan/xylan/chitin deacetylase (PgdA/CDA1 family) n=1 Tax=Haloferula luteola TaxID=595692 RepID=A0A840VCW0_9BACT|nr:polysaccharide deacetylase family protein [Haloferula luteola]MBB5353364.1 peptidoglycan/xylan/chitin deacetylase (PgdA/CDA1 family) [Haloferula luteola]